MRTEREVVMMSRDDEKFGWAGWWQPTPIDEAIAKCVDKGKRPTYAKTDLESYSKIKNYLWRILRVSNPEDDHRRLGRLGSCWPVEA